MSNALYPTLAGLMWDITKTPIFNTVIQRAADLSELRASYASEPVYDITLKYDILRDDAVYNEFRTLLGFYNARQGAFDSFLYLDPDDSVALLQGFGTGDASTTQFQLARAVGNSSASVGNIAPGLTVQINGTPTVAYTIDSKGLVTFTTAPGSGAALTWSGAYYMRCRFKTEDSPITFNQFMSKLWETGTVAMRGTYGTQI